MSGQGGIGYERARAEPLIMPRAIIPQPPNGVGFQPAQDGNAVKSLVARQLRFLNPRGDRAAPQADTARNFPLQPGRYILHRAGLPRRAGNARADQLQIKQLPRIRIRLRPQVIQDMDQPRVIGKGVKTPAVRGFPPQVKNPAGHIIHRLLAGQLPIQLDELGPAPGNRLGGSSLQPIAKIRVAIKPRTRRFVEVTDVIRINDSHLRVARKKRPPNIPDSGVLQLRVNMVSTKQVSIPRFFQC